MCRIEKRQNCGFYNFWYYDHDQEGYGNFNFIFYSYKVGLESYKVGLERKR